MALPTRLAAPGRAVEALLDDLLRDAEAPGDVALREPLEEVRLDDLALLVGEALGDGGADGVVEVGAGLGDLALVGPERAGAGEAPRDRRSAGRGARPFVGAPTVDAQTRSS